MISFGPMVGGVFAAAGVALSAAAFRHDVHRVRISREVPQAAPKRIAPEIHAIAAVVAGVGVGFVWGVLGGIGWAVAHAALAYFVIRPRIES